MEYVAGADEASVKPTTLERRAIQSTKPALVWQLSHAFDHTCGQALARGRSFCIKQEDNTRLSLVGSIAGMREGVSFRERILLFIIF